MCPATGLPVQQAVSRDRRVERPPRIPKNRPRKVEDLLGKFVSGYRVIGVIGQGGMGTVYEAETLSGPRMRVALKVLKPEQLARREAVSRFEREGRVLASIAHPNICRVFDVGRLEDGSPFMVMERLEGESLATRIEREGTMRPHELVPILLEALRGLDAAHRQSVVHRDFKPDNIFVGARGSIVKVLDFGISKNTGLEEPAAQLTRTGMVMGTPYYMAPEQAMGDRNLDGRVDVWAAGVVLYEGLSGKRPFTAKNYNALLVQILTTAPKPIEEIVSGLSPLLVGIIRRALEKKREARFQTVVELAQALGQLFPPRRDAGRLLTGRGETSGSPRTMTRGAVIGQQRADLPALLSPESVDDDEPIVTIRQRRRPSSHDLRPPEGPDSIEDEPTTVLSRGDTNEETPHLDDQDATQVDPPRFLDPESTTGGGSGERGRR
jgi:serine/threonine protein kinase